MPMPSAYRHASRDWQAILEDLRDGLDLASDHMAYTALDSVLQVFRRRLTAQQGLDFAGVLPAVPRAIFVAGWRPAGTPPPFPDRATLTREVQLVRRHHNLTPVDGIAVVARVIRSHCDAQDFARVLTTLPQGAADFWQVDSS